jgi:hypothetical protein
MSSLATPAASVADTGALAGGAPTPSVDLENPQGTPPGGEPGGGAAAEPGAGAPPEGGQREAGSDADQGTQPQGADGDARVIPAKWREAFKNDPELRGLFFRDRALTKEFPGGIQEVRALRDTLETVGGESGLQEIQTNLADFRTLANQFLDGDPAYIRDVFETDPVAAVSHLPAYLDAALKADEPSYNRIMAQKISGEHEAWGLRATLKSIYDLPNLPPEAKALLNKINEWSLRLKEIGEQEEDPRVKKLQDQIKAGRKSEEQNSIKQLNQSYQAESMQAIDKSVNRILDSFLKGRKLSDEDRKAVIEQIISRADKAIGADAEFKKQRDAAFQRAIQTGKKDGAVKIASARWEKELGIVVPKVVRLFALGDGKAAPAPAPANGGQQRQAPAGKGTKVAAPPAANAIDTYRTTQNMISKEHRAILKDGTQVFWELAG